MALATKSALALSGLLGLGALLRFLAHQPDPGSPTEFDLGPASNYPPGSRTALPQAGAVLLHTPAGFQALSLACPHLGCQVNIEKDGFACPCHGSRFDPSGALLNGPAAAPLKSLKVELNEQGRLILHTS